MRVLYRYITGSEIKPYPNHTLLWPSGCATMPLDCTPPYPPPHTHSSRTPNPLPVHTNGTTCNSPPPTHHSHINLHTYTFAHLLYTYSVAHRRADAGADATSTPKITHSRLHRQLHPQLHPCSAHIHTRTHAYTNTANTDPHAPLCHTTTIPLYHLPAIFLPQKASTPPYMHPTRILPFQLNEHATTPYMHPTRILPFQTSTQPHPIYAHHTHTPIPNERAATHSSQSPRNHLAITSQSPRNHLAITSRSPYDHLQSARSH